MQRNKFQLIFLDLLFFFFLSFIQGKDVYDQTPLKCWLITHHAVEHRALFTALQSLRHFVEFFLPDVALFEICTQQKKHNSEVLPFGKMTK